MSFPLTIGNVSQARYSDFVNLFNSRYTELYERNKFLVECLRISQIASDDLPIFDSYNTTPQNAAEGLLMIIQKGREIYERNYKPFNKECDAPSSPRYVTVVCDASVFKINGFHTKGEENVECYFCNDFNMATSTYKIENMATGLTCTINDLALHLLEKHWYCGGDEKRLDPSEVCLLIGLQKRQVRYLSPIWDWE